MEIDSGTFKLQHPFSLIVSGVTQSGKTQFCKRLLLELKDIVTPCPARIIISYTENQPAYEELSKNVPGIEFRQGLDFDLSEFNPKQPSIIIIDDQMNDVVANGKIQTLFTRGIHHSSVSVVLLTQNLYPQGKHGRDIRLNSHYLVVMKSPTFAAQISYLGRQLFPKNPAFLPDAYKNATAKPYSYLLINLHPLCDDRVRVLQGLFHRELKFAYLPK
jgi:hypothetical protein